MPEIIKMELLQKYYKSVGESRGQDTDDMIVFNQKYLNACFIINFATPPFDHVLQNKGGQVRVR